ncbi:MAG: threonylcarbamoyl-AMP synthase [Promethearchaeota archaeon]|nr:MAG: threonylcarbamoyl-AMP synthase [Candidatus Lokiarchaeota archaeon]
MGILVKLSNKKIEDIQVYLETAVEYIIEGKILAFPTNSVYGIGGDPLNLDLVDRLFRIKFRERDKGFLLLVSDLEEALKIAEFNEISMKLANHFWPGQLSLILKRKESCFIPTEVTANKSTIGIRMPENEIILKILNMLKLKGYFGGIIGTSANYSGEKESISGQEVVKNFLGTGVIDFIIDGGKTKSKIPTTIIDCTGEDLKFLRIGKITEEEIRSVL